MAMVAKRKLRMKMIFANGELTRLRSMASALQGDMVAI
jgi:hypothetical protein